MKKLVKIASVAMAAVMMLSAVPFTTASAATKKVVDSANVKKGIKLSWKKTSKAKKYTVYRSTTKSKGYKSLGKTKNLTFTDKKVNAGKTYYYKVKASTGYTYKIEKAVRLNAPTLKSAKVVDGDSIKITWSKIKGAKKYNVYVMEAGDKEYEYLDTTTSTSYVNTWVLEGTYKYRVTAVNGGSESIRSNFKKVTYKEPLAAPSGFAYMNQDRTGMKVVFEQKADAVGYRIYRSTDDGKKFDLLKDIKAAEVEKADGIYSKIETLMDVLFKDMTSASLGLGLDIKFGQFIDTDVTYGNKYTYAIEYYTAKETSDRDVIGLSKEYKEADVEMKVGETSEWLYKLSDEQKAELSAIGMNEEVINAIMGFFDIKHEAENSEIVSIDENNNIVALKAGKTNITSTLSLDIEGILVSIKVKSVVKVNEAETPSEPAPSEPTQEPSETPSESTPEASETPSESTPESSETPSESTPESSETPSESIAATEVPPESITQPTDPSETVKAA